MGDCPDEREAKARRQSDLFTVKRSALGKGAALWSCVIRMPAGKRGTIVLNLRVIQNPDGGLTRPAISVSLEPVF